jgi:hypothetical protein
MSPKPEINDQFVKLRNRENSIGNRINTKNPIRLGARNAKYDTFSIRWRLVASRLFWRVPF